MPARLLRGTQNKHHGDDREFANFQYSHDFTVVTLVHRQILPRLEENLLQEDSGTGSSSVRLIDLGQFIFRNKNASETHRSRVTVLLFRLKSLSQIPIKLKPD